MSIIAGIVLTTVAIGTTTWATVGGRIAAIPSVARVVAWLGGGYNIPSDAKVGRLQAAAAQGTALGMPDPDSLLPPCSRNFDGRYPMTWAEEMRQIMTPHVVSEDDIDAAFGSAAHPAETGWRAWLAGGYAMPTAAEIDAAPPYTKRGACRLEVPRDFVFSDEPPLVVRLPNPTGLGDAP